VTRSAPTRESSLAAAVLAVTATTLLPAASHAQTLRVRNNHELPYAGPVNARVALPDGHYAGPGASAEVRGGALRALVSLAPGAEARLTRTASPASIAAHPFRAGPLAATPAAGGAVALAWDGRPAAALDLGLVVLPGTTATVDSAVAAFRPTPLTWAEQPDGSWRAEARQDGFRVAVTLAPYGGGWLDATARVERETGAAGPAYVALVRRVTTPGVGADARVRLNGRVLDGASSPDTWDRDFWYVKGVDWARWSAGPLGFLAVNGFTPTPTIQNAKGEWVEGSHFYVWERTRRVGDATYLVSEIAGPNPDQAKSRYMPVTQYAPMRAGDALVLSSRLAIATQPAAGWEEAQLRGFAGHRLAAGGASRGAPRDSATVDVGVRAVTFGTAYFPYSTFVENLDYYRTPGTDRETWWAVSPKQWAQWRAYVPRMRTDLRIIRAMGFDVVRLHHLELLQQLPRAEALAFLDWYAQEARTLGLRILVDTEGPAEWVTTLASRYRDVLEGIEIENEILIGGVKPGSAERWASLHAATKRGAPGLDAFLTTAGNHGQFERLRQLGTPFDRVGLHAYKHGANWKESFLSHALGTGGYASDLGLPATLGEFNWKDITRLSPEQRHREVAEIFESILKPRALPQVYQFQFHEMLGVSPSISLNGGRHYEAVALDRRPKPEAQEWVRLIRTYGASDAPVRELPITVQEATLATSRAATATFTVENRTGRAVALTLAPQSFDGVVVSLQGQDRVTLAPGATHTGRIALRLAAGARPGTYHHFVRVAYQPADAPRGATASGAKTAWGWGVAANPGAPTFVAPVLGARVTYAGGADLVRSIDWTRPVAVAWGEKASVLEVEMAFLVASTLQSATGRPVRVSALADVPDSLARAATLVLVGTSETHALVRQAALSPAPSVGTVALHDAGDGRRWLLLTGADKAAVQAAATDFVLRFWPQAKDATMRLTGREPGNLLGHKAGVTEADPP
jgi:hypothetical protein